MADFTEMPVSKENLEALSDVLQLPGRFWGLSTCFAIALFRLEVTGLNERPHPAYLELSGLSGYFGG